MSVHENWAFENLLSGATFAEICEGLCDWIETDQVALVAATMLKQWVCDGWIAGLNARTNELG